MTALVLAELRGGALEATTRSLVTAALACDRSVDVLVIGNNCEGAVREAGSIAGVAGVLVVDADDSVGNIAEHIAETITGLAPSYGFLIFAGTTQGKSVAPRVAAGLGVAQVSDVTAIIAPDTFERPIHAGNAIATLQTSDPIKVLTVRTTAFPRADAGSGAPVRHVPFRLCAAAATLVRRDRPVQERADLLGASVVVSGGRGLGSAEQFLGLLGPLADRLGAALGATRAAVDAGYAPNNWQVGQTGKVIAPELYIACGLSGAIHHLAGMKDSKVIVAINTDPEAPILEIADYALVGDLFIEVPALTRLLTPVA